MNIFPHKPTGLKGPLLAAALCALLPGLPRAQMNMNPYFSTINSPLDEHSLMLMALPDLQAARHGRDFASGMLMAQYGLTSRWTAGVMAEWQAITGKPANFGGMRYNTYFHPFKDDRLLNLSVYGEYEDLNGAALYKMEVAGFESGDLREPLARARHTHARTFEQRLLVYHDWDRLNATFNFIRETPLQSPHGSVYGYALGVYRKPSWMSGMADMPGMKMPAPPALAWSRLGLGAEMIGGLGDNERFGFYWNAQQHYLGPVLTYDFSARWSLRVEPAAGLSRASDPFLLRLGLSCMFSPG